VHTFRGLAPKRAFWRAAQLDTVRFALIKVAGRITELASRSALALPSDYPYRDSLSLLAARAALPPWNAGRRTPTKPIPCDPPALMIAPPAPGFDAPSITAGRSHQSLND
jgi:DDE family transposase